MDRNQALLDEVAWLLRGHARKHLTLPDLLTLVRRGNVVLPVDPTHLGCLWVLDRSHTGRVTINDLLALVELCRTRARHYQSFELEAQLQGYCTLQMWRALSGPDGVQQFAAWICALALESSPERRAFSRHGRQQYVGRDAVAALHALLRVQQTQSLDLQAFLDLLQRCAEERRLMELSDEAQDDWVPLDTIRELAQALFRSSCKLLQDICPAGELRAVP
ncbi:hypothetical protein C2E21_6322 [Chlorella sorokiniana]|uniref:EF-hand domain-containing protein n=1 Tax=Chlorella sorokiniana TaxID=3076 RepID=A0A2P6TLS1_CHLSO|nr:hypothetical protein C2E21_6322 [Chlorella sorokiniana]|eukprot:PRW45239.1 hypothetical protein C2E21_6322 [Chlorella sorokiniana]